MIITSFLAYGIQRYLHQLNCKTMNEALNKYPYYAIIPVGEVVSHDLECDKSVIITDIDLWYDVDSGSHGIELIGLQELMNSDTGKLLRSNISKDFPKLKDNDIRWHLFSNYIKE